MAIYTHDCTHRAFGGSVLKRFDEWSICEEKEAKMDLKKKWKRKGKNDGIGEKMKIRASTAPKKPSIKKYPLHP
jgi:hypothetical protein